LELITLKVAPDSSQARVEASADLPSVEGTELAAQGWRFMVGFHGVDSRSDPRIIDRLQVLPAMKQQVRGELDLLQPPVIARLERADHRTGVRGPLVQLVVQLLRRPVVRRSSGRARNRQSGGKRCQPGVADLFTLEPAGRTTVPIEINRQSERTPGGDTHLTQAELFIAEIGVVVVTLAVIGTPVGLAGALLGQAR